MKVSIKTSSLEQPATSNGATAAGGDKNKKEDKKKKIFFIMGGERNSMGRYLAWIGEKIWQEVTNHLLLAISLLAAVGTSFFNTPQWGYIDAKVIICLFELMLIVKALEQYGLLRNIAVNIASRCKDKRQLTAALCMIAFFLSMLMTNDVAVLTVIPILIVIAQVCDFSAALPCVLITVAANLGSAMTPIGNPQNLYIFSFYDMSPAVFFEYSAPLCIVSLLLIIASSLFIQPEKLQLGLDNAPVSEKKKTAAFLLLSVPVIGGVMNFIPYAFTLMLLLMVTVVIDRSLLRKPDYRLLLTFVFLFIAVGNVSHIPELKGQIAALADSPIKTYVSSLLLSQVISNVPSAVMLAPFTGHIRALFYGVNIGGLGTPIASLASIIGFSLFCRAFAHEKARFLRDFLIYNIGLFLVLGAVFSVVVMKS